jgi:hypothetical protein
VVLLEFFFVHDGCSILGSVICSSVVMFSIFCI